MDSCNQYEVGGKGPFNEIIKEIIFQSDEVIVYMDAKGVIQWSSYIGIPDGFGDISSKISDWEFKANALFDEQEAYKVKTILAEGYARLFSDNNFQLATQVVNGAIDTIRIKGENILKQYYTFSATIATILIAFACLLSKVLKSEVVRMCGEEGYSVWITMLFGGIGAYVFTTVRAKDYRPDIVISKNIHALDGALRIFYGVIAGLIVSIAVKSNLVLGFLNHVDKGIYVMLFLGICAGASELLIPNIIKQVEDNTSGNSKK